MCQLLKNPNPLQPLPEAVSRRRFPALRAGQQDTDTLSSTCCSHSLSWLTLTPCWAPQGGPAPLSIAGNPTAEKPRGEMGSTSLGEADLDHGQHPRGRGHLPGRASPPRWCHRSSPPRTDKPCSGTPRCPARTPYPLRPHSNRGLGRNRRHHTIKALGRNGSVPPPPPGTGTRIGCRGFMGIKWGSLAHRDTNPNAGEQ